MLIEVTSDHIKNGKPGECDKCPIALALDDAGFNFPRVLSQHVEVDSIYFTLPRRAQWFVQRFDTKKPVKPFRFRLDTL